MTNPERGWGGMLTTADAIQLVIAITLFLTLVVLIADRR